MTVTSPPRGWVKCWQWSVIHWVSENWCRDDCYCCTVGTKQSWQQGVLFHLLSTHSIQVPLMDLLMLTLITARHYLLQKCTVHFLVDSSSVITAQLSTGQPLVHTSYKPATVRTMTKYWSYYWRDCNQKLCTITQSLPVMTHYSWRWKLKEFSSQQKQVKIRLSRRNVLFGTM